MLAISPESKNPSRKYWLSAGNSGTSEGDGLSNKIMQACRKSLSKYKVPRKIEFRRELPKSMSGKVLKRQIIDEHRRQEANRTTK